MSSFDTNVDMQKLDYNQLIFLQINRIGLTSSKEFNTSKEKILSFRWQVEGLRSLIPDELLTESFIKLENEILVKIGSIFEEDKMREDKVKYKEFYHFINKYYRMCINLFAENGLLYKKSSIGLRK